MRPLADETRIVESRGTTAVLVDGHVHFHPSFEASRFLDGAAENFAQAARKLGFQGARGILLLTEARGEKAFERLQRALDDGSTPGWSARSGAEETSFTALRDGGDSLVVVAGRQVATRDGIEVLAFNIRQELLDGLSIDETLAAVWDAGSVAVIPWGFGKWWGRRGRVVLETLARHHGRPLALGDNAGRPELSMEPALFRRAREWSIGVVPGTDPLPFASEAGRAGRFGFLMRHGVDPIEPGRSLVEALRAPGGQLETYGTRERLWNFARLQLGMQWRMRVARVRP